MPDIKTLDAIVEKYTRVTPGRSRDFQLGVENPRRDWMDATLAAEDTWERAMQEAIADRRHERGVRRAGTRKWQENTISKGVSRWSQGVGMAGGSYREGFAPYRDLIESIDLPPRGPRGSPENLERVRIIAEQLHALKLRLGGR